MTPIPNNAAVVGREGRRFLLADAGTDTMRPARVHDLTSNKTTPDQPVKILYKWANWDDATDADYQAALAAPKD